MSGLNWDKATTKKLLQTIAEDPGYRHTLFGKALYKGKENRKWAATRDLCVTLFQDEAGWIASMRKRGLLKREGGAWVATDEWTGRVNDPVKGLLNRLIKEMEDGFFVIEYGIDPKWTRWEDIPDRRKRGESPPSESFRRAYPHYFILHDLVSNDAPYRPLVERSTASRGRASDRVSTVAVLPQTRNRTSKRLRSVSPVRFEPYDKQGRVDTDEMSEMEEGMSWSNPVVVDSSPPSPVTQLASAGPGPSTIVARGKSVERQIRRRIQLPSPSPTPSPSVPASTINVPSRPIGRSRPEFTNGTRSHNVRPPIEARSARRERPKSEQRTAEEVIIALQNGNSSDHSSISAIFGVSRRSSDSSDSEADSEDSESSFDFGNISRKQPAHPHMRQNATLNVGRGPGRQARPLRRDRAP